jgi:hypothetical protein
MLKGGFVDARMIILCIQALAQIATGVAGSVLSGCFSRLRGGKEIIVFDGWLLL